MTRLFETGATRDDDSAKLDYEGFISPLVDRRYAEYMHQCRLRNVPSGQTIRASDNWQKGMPLESYAKSLVRHGVEFRLLHDGFKAFDDKGIELDIETVLCAIRFNVDGYLFELEKKKHGKTNDPVGSGGGDLSGVPLATSLDESNKAVLEMLRGHEDNWRPYKVCPICSKDHSP